MNVSNTNFNLLLDQPFVFKTMNKFCRRSFKDCHGLSFRRKGDLKARNLTSSLHSVFSRRRDGVGPIDRRKKLMTSRESMTDFISHSEREETSPVEVSG